MSKVLAAIDASGAAFPVLHEAELFGDFVGASPEAIYVGRRGARASQVAKDVGVPLRVLHGRPAPTILHEAGAEDVVLAIVGTRDLQSGPFPVGHITRRLIQQLAKAVVVVPPQFTPTRLAHILVPLDGTRETGLAVAAVVGLLVPVGSDFVVLHTLTPDTMPKMLDHTGGLEMWGEYFLRRVCPELADAPIELRVGAPGANVAEFATAESTDLIVLAWRHSFAGRHGQVVLDTLAHARVPVLLLPMNFALAGPDPQR